MVLVENDKREGGFFPSELDTAIAPGNSRYIIRYRVRSVVFDGPGKARAAMVSRQ